VICQKVRAAYTDKDYLLVGLIKVHYLESIAT